MTGALLWHKQVTPDAPVRRINLDEPTGRPRLLIFGTHGRPQRSAPEFECIAFTESIKGSQKASTESEHLNAPVLPVRHIHCPGRADLNGVR